MYTICISLNCKPAEYTSNTGHYPHHSATATSHEIWAILDQIELTVSDMATAKNGKPRQLECGMVIRKLSNIHVDEIIYYSLTCNLLDNTFGLIDDNA